MEPIRLYSSEFAGRGDSVLAVVESFLEAKRLLARNNLIAPAYFKRLDRHCRDFARHHGNYPLSACRRSLLQNWILQHPEWQDGATRDDAAKSIVSCFKWAEGEGLIERCPFKAPRGVWAPAEPRRPIAPEQYRQLMRFARESNGRGRRARPGRVHFRLICWFLWETGARTGEARALKWSDVDLQKGAAFLQEHKTKKKVGGARVVPLSPRVVRVLGFLYTHRREDRPHVFLNSRGRAWTRANLGRRFRVYARLAGLPEDVSAYSLRHGFVVSALEAGCGDRAIADVIGQSSTRYVSWYGSGARHNLDYLKNTVRRARGD